MARFFRFLSAFYLLLAFYSSASYFHFLGREIPEKKWVAATDTLKCWSTQGDWNNETDGIKYYFEDFDTGQNGPSNSRRCHHYYNSVRHLTYPYSLSWYTDSKKCPVSYESQWSKQHLCESLHGKNILIVGDSISTQFYQTLVLINTGDTSLNTVNCTVETPHSAHPYINIHFLRNDILTIANVTHDNKEEDHLAYSWATQYEWEPSIKDLNISLVVLNRGAHYVHNNVLVERLTTVFDYLTKKHPTVTFLFRNTPVGHVGCPDLFQSAPYATVPALVGEPSHPDWHWQEIADQNAITRELIHSKYPHIVYFDVYKLTMLRPDHHCLEKGDCFHYCFHSVIDSWAIFFTNIVHLLHQAAS